MGSRNAPRFFIDTYISVRYTNYIEVQCIALKGLNYGRTY